MLIKLKNFSIIRLRDAKRSSDTVQDSMHDPGTIYLIEISSTP